jgi:excisionase family DNA binding protein
MTKEWITVSDAAELSGYHPEHIRRLIRDGKIDARKFGPLWQVSYSSLRDYLALAERTDDRRRGPKPN